MTTQETKVDANTTEEELAYRAGWAQASIDPMFRGTVDAGWREWSAYRDFVNHGRLWHKPEVKQ